MLICNNNTEMHINANVMEDIKTLIVGFIKIKRCEEE
jgi:hypothetical protein